MKPGFETIDFSLPKSSETNRLTCVSLSKTIFSETILQTISEWNNFSFETILSETILQTQTISFRNNLSVKQF